MKEIRITQAGITGCQIDAFDDLAQPGHKSLVTITLHDPTMTVQIIQRLLPVLMYEIE